MLRVNDNISRLLFLCLFSLILITSCTSADKKSDDAEGAFAIAQEYDNEERYEEAIKRYQEVRNKFPYSKFASMSSLAIADAYYKQESFAEAQVSYQSFRDLHPRHPKSDYVLFRLAMSYFKQLPATIDRDLTLANNTIVYFDELIKKFPNSTHISEATENRKSVLRMLAEKENYIAEFYFIREMYDSALLRYEGLIKKYPTDELIAQAISRAAISASKIGDTPKANKWLSELQRQFPDSNELRQAKDEVK